jgi:hypothetical protein
MRTLYLVSTIYIVFAVTGCSTVEQPASHSTYNTKQITGPIQQPACATKNNPLKVSFYTHSTPSVPYKIIGEESISKYNLGGNKRQEANIRDGMRELAAAMGGDAIINIKHDSKSVSGTIVAYLNKEITKG